MNNIEENLVMMPATMDDLKKHSILVAKHACSLKDFHLAEKCQVKSSQAGLEFSHSIPILLLYDIKKCESESIISSIYKHSICHLKNKSIDFLEEVTAELLDYFFPLDGCILITFFNANASSSQDYKHFVIPASLFTSDAKILPFKEILEDMFKFFGNKKINLKVIRLLCSYTIYADCSFFLKQADKRTLIPKFRNKLVRVADMEIQTFSSYFRELITINWLKEYCY